MTLIELEFCQLTRLAIKATPIEGKKRATEGELKALAAKTALPDKYYWLWVGTKNDTYQKMYLSACQNMTEKDKKSYRTIPGVCAKLQKVESQLQKKKNDETNAP
jgi:hypothetical protein